MRIIKLLLPVFLVFISAACAQEKPVSRDFCQKAAQCVIVEDACPNGWQAINRDYLKDYNKELAEMRMRVRCFAGPIPGLKAPTETECIHNKCTVKEPAH